MFWTKKVRSTPKDKAELEAFQRDSQAMREEADRLLREAKAVGDAHRKSRLNNHYRLVLDDIFKGHA